MAVLIEGLSVVIRCKAIINRFKGGQDDFLNSLPNKTLCSDGELASINFMAPKDVKAYVEYLTESGLVFKQANKAVDLVVVDQQSGMTVDCDWAEIGESDWNNNPDQAIRVCCAKPTKIDRIFVPEGWDYKKSLTANGRYVEGGKLPENLEFRRSENGVDVLFDKDAGQEFYVRR